MNKQRDEILKTQSITKNDIFIFKWRIPQILCEVPPSWGALTDIELMIRSALNAFENGELKRDFLSGKSDNIYKAIIDDVMDDLVVREVALKDKLTIPYGDREMDSYRKGISLFLLSIYSPYKKKYLRQVAEI